METSKQVRVDNWGIFFLQRLQIFFNKTDFCDLTLQFEGNVQLKVHRLVMNACTGYFQLLEQTCEMIEDILIMPQDLQADVVLPIVNFMYTGTLEYHVSIFDKLYKTANLMNMTILTKLLDAQRTSIPPTPKFKKPASIPVTWCGPERKTVKVEPELPAPLPSRKLPVWKRKNVPTPHKINSHYFTEQKRQAIPIDPLATVDNTPKPTRFEWPEEELPAFNLFDSTFDDISYSSKPLFTQNEEPRPSTSSFEPVIIKNDLVEFDAEVEEKCIVKDSNKRKGDFETIPVKRVCSAINEKENQNKQASKISVSPSGKVVSSSSSSPEVDHAKIISEVLKKYPSMVKKNKNIRLKILAKSNGSPPLNVKKISQLGPSLETTNSNMEQKEDNGPWQCTQCSTPTEPVEFVLYYLYRKHMTDVHFEKFDSRMCKFCGHKSSKHTLLMYHQYTKHGVKPPLAYTFPKCNQCPYIALNEVLLSKHKTKHNATELQCVDCNVTFTNQQALTSHMQITGHTGKLPKPTYDCQYCAKKCQSSTILFVHIRQNHREEARRDGIVSIDEAIEEDEYVIPEQFLDGRRDKIKILSDVKLPTVEVQQQAVPLEPSSEAEALNNVATGIATSLGLVDVVVLDDNQQYILHADNQQGISEGDTEFVLPDLQDTQAFTEAHNQVVSPGQNVTMLHNTDINSTDELVMVLTDQDYTNEHRELLEGDHSNIVVLYSHPVECTNNQFVSTRNIVLTSQSGLIDLRNTNTIVTSSTSDFIMTPSQVTVPSQIESIELIQREINGNPVEDNSKCKDNQEPITQKEEVLEQIVEALPIQEKATNDTIKDDIVVDDQTGAPILENSCANVNTSDTVGSEENIKSQLYEQGINSDFTQPGANDVHASIERSDMHIVEESCDTEAVIEPTDNNEQQEKLTENIEPTAHPEEIIPENIESHALPEEIIAIDNDGKDNQTDIESQDPLSEEPQQPLEETTQDNLLQNENDVVMECAPETTSSSVVVLESTSIEQPLQIEERASLPKSNEITNKSLEEDPELESKEMETVNVSSSPAEESTAQPEDDLAPSVEIVESLEHSLSLQIQETPSKGETLEPQLENVVSEPQIETPQIEEVTVDESVCNIEEERNTPNSHESSPQPQAENPKSNSKEPIITNKLATINRKTAKIILEDWDESDSQHSDSRSLNVNKIIDDWDDEDEDAKK